MPGWYGIWWVKWPTEIVLSDLPYERFDGFWQSRRYTYQDPTGTVLSVVREQLPRAVVVSPSDGSAVTGAGTAADPGVGGREPRHGRRGDRGRRGPLVRGLERRTRQPVGPGPTGRRRCPAGLPRGLRRVGVRATDEAGRSQDWQPVANRLGYGNNGIHVVELDLLGTDAGRDRKGPRPMSSEVIHETGRLEAFADEVADLVGTALDDAAHDGGVLDEQVLTGAVASGCGRCSQPDSPCRRPRPERTPTTT